MAVAVIDSPVEPLDQRYVEPTGAPETVKRISLPTHTVAAPSILRLGREVTDTRCESVDLQPLASVTVTV